jgi:hypothetical protein
MTLGRGLDPIGWPSAVSGLPAPADRIIRMRDGLKLDNQLALAA